MQDEIFSRFTEEPDGWLFFLGFCSENIALSPSLTFWRTFSVLFVGKLRLTPDLEDLRSRAVIPLSDDERGPLLESWPMLLTKGPDSFLRFFFAPPSLAAQPIAPSLIVLSALYCSPFILWNLAEKYLDQLCR